MVSKPEKEKLNRMKTNKIEQPRIDPQQLLVCLTPLLASNGGIKSSAEVIRLAR